MVSFSDFHFLSGRQEAGDSCRSPSWKVAMENGLVFRFSFSVKRRETGDGSFSDFHFPSVRRETGNGSLSDFHFLFSKRKSNGHDVHGPTTTYKVTGRPLRNKIPRGAERQLVGACRLGDRVTTDAHSKKGPNQVCSTSRLLRESANPNPSRPWMMTSHEANEAGSPLKSAQVGTFGFTQSVVGQTTSTAACRVLCSSD